mmetsp:Transcript_3954/g.6035  ORF Transcript_3954/g.6035 Transcript_3954/m.6035 type:complete len:228 (-) Transcript_3954:1406-2089(-)
MMMMIIAATVTTTTATAITPPTAITSSSTATIIMITRRRRKWWRWKLHGYIGRRDRRWKRRRWHSVMIIAITICTITTMIKAWLCRGKHRLRYRWWLHTVTTTTRRWRDIGIRMNRFLIMLLFLWIIQLGERLAFSHSFLLLDELRQNRTWCCRSTPGSSNRIILFFFFFFFMFFHIPIIVLRCCGCGCCCCSMIGISVIADNLAHHGHSRSNDHRTTTIIIVLQLV